MGFLKDSFSSLGLFYSPKSSNPKKIPEDPIKNPIESIVVFLQRCVQLKVKRDSLGFFRILEGFFYKFGTLLLFNSTKFSKNLKKSQKIFKDPTKISGNPSFYFFIMKVKRDSQGSFGILKGFFFKFGT